MSSSAPKHRSKSARRPAPRLTPVRTEVPAPGAGTVSIPGVAVLPLRFFLGVTFVYAAFQKLTDPGFLTPGAGTYIGAQLIAFGRGSPVGFLLRHFAEHAQFFGLLTIATEMVIGILILIGLFTRGAALVGLSLNLVFFLSASWSTYPYFMGADIVFVVCWLTLALTGPGPFALDTMATNLHALVPGSARRLTHVPMEPGPAGTRSVVSRAELMAAGGATAVLLLLGLLPRSRPTGGASAPIAPAVPAPSGGPASASGAPPGAQKVGSLANLPVNSALASTDPKTGDPALVVHTPSGVVAYDAVCTHAGCTVEYDPGYKLMVCPCHGGAFDPVHGAQVVSGPPPSPLTQLPIYVDHQGDIFIS